MRPLTQKFIKSKTVSPPARPAAFVFTVAIVFVLLALALLKPMDATAQYCNYAAVATSTAPIPVSMQVCQYAIFTWNLNADPASTNFSTVALNQVNYLPDWYDNAGGIQITISATTPPAGQTQTYLVWTANQCNITINTNGQFSLVIKDNLGNNITAQCIVNYSAFSTTGANDGEIAGNAVGYLTITWPGSAPCAPSITAQTTNATTCASSAPTFSVTATGTGLTYQWQYQPAAGGGFGAIAGATSSSYTLSTSAVTATNSGDEYDLVVTAACSQSVTSAPAPLTVNLPPTVNSSTASQIVCAGSVAGFTVNATGSALTYQWSLNGSLLAGATNSTYSIPSTATTNAGSYVCVVSGACSPPATNTAATLTVNARPTAVVSGTASICNGSSTTISAALTGTAPWNVMWSDGVNQSGVAGSPATRSVSPGSSTVYTVTNLTDANCTAQAGDLTGNATVVLAGSGTTLAVTCPGDVTAVLATNACTVTNVALGTPAVTGGCAVTNLVNNAPAGFNLGTNFVTWTATDANGSTASCTQQVIVVDTTPPAINVNADLTVPASPGLCYATNVTLLAPAATDNCLGVNVSSNVPSQFVIGTNFVTWTATDASGNTASSVQNVIVQDTQPPTLDTNADLSVPASPGLCYAANVALVAPAATDNCAGVSVSSNVPPQFLIGTNLVTWTATDASGNTASSLQNVIVQDTQPPTLDTNADLTVPASLGVCYATNVSLVPPNASDLCEAVSVTNNAPAQFPVGTNIVTWTAVDTSGNTATSTQNVIVQDTQRPTINCPADMIVVADQGQCYASGVSIGTASGSDNCGVVNIRNNAPFQFSVGVDTVLWTAADPSGNISFCVQHVTVLDTQPPVISCPPDISLTNTSPVSGVDLGLPSASDNCSVTNVTNNAPAQFPVGTSIVTWTATDASGNTANCEQRVTVGSAGPSSLLTATLNVDGSLTLNYTGVPSQQYHVQVSSNLEPSPNWMDLPGSTNPAAGNGAFNFTDTNTAQFNPRFYRTVSP